MVLSLAPLRPDKVAATREFERLVCYLIVLIAGLWSSYIYTGVIHVALPIELLLFLGHSIPPASAADDLSDAWVIIAFTNIEPEYAWACLWLYVPVLSIKNLVQFLQ